MEYWPTLDLQSDSQEKMQQKLKVFWSHLMFSFKRDFGNTKKTKEILGFFVLKNNEAQNF